MLLVKDLNKSFNKKKVLNNIGFEVNKGDVFGFIGCNGAGKSTTIKCILNFVFPDSGVIEFNGKPTSHKSFRNEIGYLPEVAQFPKNLTAFEFLSYSAGFYKHKISVSREKIEALLREVGLEDAKKKLIRNFSKGMKQRLGIAQAVIHNPQMLILDEPFTGLDPIGRHRLKNILKNLHNQGKTIFFSSHNLNEVEELCSVICVIHNGNVFYQGKISDFVAKYNADNLEQAFIKSYYEAGGKDVECN